MTSKQRNCYTYFIGWSKFNTFYYGRRTAVGCDPSDLFTSYFTSSLYVKNYIKENGLPDIVQIRKVFGENFQACEKWETDVLRKMKVASRVDFLNKIQSSTHSTTGLFPGYTKEGIFIGMIPCDHPEKDKTIFSNIAVDPNRENINRQNGENRKNKGIGWKNSAGVSVARISVNNGTHPGLRKNRTSIMDEYQKNKVADGTHHWLTEEHKRKTSENSIKRIQEKTHKFSEPTFCEVCGKTCSVASYRKLHSTKCYLYPGSSRNILYIKKSFVFAYDTKRKINVGKIHKDKIIGDLIPSLKDTSVYTNEQGKIERLARSDERIEKFNLQSNHKGKVIR